jgi:hypothetical protein
MFATFDLSFPSNRRSPGDRTEKKKRKKKGKLATKTSEGDSRMSPRISDLFVYYSACVIIILFSLVSDWLPGTDRDREDRLPNRSHKHITKKKAPFPDCERWSERNDGLKRKQQSSPDGPIFVKQPLLLLLQLCVYFTTGSRGGLLC